MHEQANSARATYRLHLVARYFNLPIGQWAAGQLFSDVTTVACRHRLQLPTDLTLLIRVIAMSEGLGIQLDPNFNLLAFTEPYLKRFWLQSRGPTYLASKISEGMVDLAELGLGCRSVYDAWQARWNEAN